MAQRIYKGHGRPRDGDLMPDGTIYHNRAKIGNRGSNKPALTPEQAQLYRDPSTKIRNSKNDFGQENVEPGDNSRYLRLARVAMNLAPINPHDPVQLEGRINEYFDFCEQNDMKPNIIGMANWIGVSRVTLNAWRRGEMTAEENTEVINKARIVLEDMWQMYMMNGKINPASGIFLGKNLFGYRDVQDVVVEPKNPLGDVQDADELRKRIEADIVVDVTDDATDIT